MYLRERNSNISIEKAIYLPAQKDEHGTVIKPAVRTTKYLGSIHTWTRFSGVPAELLEELTAEEQSELRQALAKNEPRELAGLEELPLFLGMASRNLRDCVAKRGLEHAKKELDIHLKAAEKAWAEFFKTAQTVGLKRKPRQIASSKQVTQVIERSGDIPIVPSP